MTVSAKPLRGKSAPSFATFWAGTKVSAFEAACINSFLVRGYEYVVYSYEDIEGLPEGTVLRDASEIADRSDAGRFLIEGQPNLSHFSDLFRYRLFERSEHVWVDADMLLLRPLELASYDEILAKEDGTTVCGAIMRLSPKRTQLAELIRRTEAFRGKRMVWGATGPRLLTAVFGKEDVMRHAYPPEFFFPIHYNLCWMVLLPEFLEVCSEMCSHAFTMHLWNDRIVKIGVWKRFSPPVGSFLERRFHRDGSSRFFDDAYPEAVMASMVKNWRSRCEGGDIGLGQWLRRALPSAQLTLRRRLELPT